MPRATSRAPTNLTMSMGSASKKELDATFEAELLNLANVEDNSFPKLDINDVMVHIHALMELWNILVIASETEVGTVSTEGGMISAGGVGGMIVSMAAWYAEYAA